MTKKKLYIWVCDYSENTGEGKLARLFIRNQKLKNQFNIKFYQTKKLEQKYISTFLGILYCWQKYLKNERVCYLNYLPFWNFLLFFLLPPKTILGPITGGANFLKSNKFNYLLRGLIFPIFYKISEFMVNKRSTKIIFSTDLLKKYLNKQTIKKSKFNLVIDNIKFKKKRVKKIDFLIYFRDHKNKKNFFPFYFVKKLIKFKFSVCVIGDRLKIPLVKNYGYLKNKKVDQLQSLSRYTISSGENLLSFFILECLSNNMKILVDKNNKNKVPILRDKFIKIDYNSSKSLKKIFKRKQ